MPRPTPSIFDRVQLNRRAFLIATAACAAGGLWSCDGSLTRVPKLSGYPFTLGVASGDPSPDGMVLWTRLAPSPLDGGGMPPEPVPVAWQIAEDEAMTTVVQSGTAIALPVSAHAVHVEVAAAVQLAITAHLSALGIGEIMPWSRLAQLAYGASASVINVTDVELDGSAADVSPGPAGVVRPGSIVVS